MSDAPKKTLISTFDNSHHPSNTPQVGCGLKNKLSDEISNLHELYKQHTEENEQLARELQNFEQRCTEMQSQTEEDLSHAAALLIQVGEVEETINAVLAQTKADKMVVAHLRQEIVTGQPEFSK